MSPFEPTATSPIAVAPMANPPTPARLPPGTMIEYHDGGSIEEDLQTGTITERWLIQGNPWEAREGPGMQGLEIKSPHPHYSKPAEHEYAYLIKRRFEHHVKSATSTDRLTLATFVYQLRPCPYAYEEEEVGTLVSHLVWWSQDNPPRRLGDGVVGMSVMSPSRLLIRRYPAVRLTYQKIKDIMGELGKVNHVNFAGEGEDFWLFQNVRRKMLYGNALTLDGVYDLTLYFLGDPIRHHEFWSANIIEGAPEEPTTPEFTDMRAVHRASRLYARSAVRFDDLVDISGVIDKCFPPEPGE